MNYGSKREPIIGTDLFLGIRRMMLPLIILAFIWKNWGSNTDFLRVIIGAQVLTKDVIIEKEIVSMPVDEVLPFIASLGTLASCVLFGAFIMYLMEVLSPVLCDTYQDWRRLHKEDRRLSALYRKKTELLQQSLPIVDQALKANKTLCELEESLQVLTAEVSALRHKRCSCQKTIKHPAQQMDLLTSNRSKIKQLPVKPKPRWWEKLKDPIF